MGTKHLAWAMAAVLALCAVAAAEGPASGGFNGLEMNMGNLFRMSDAQSRSISPENFTGEKGKGGMATEGTGKNAATDLGQGWKVSPSVSIKAKCTFTLAEIDFDQEDYPAFEPGQFYEISGLGVLSNGDIVVVDSNPSFVQVARLAFSE